MNRLAGLLAKSPTKAYPRGELLTDHLAAALAAAERLRQRVGRVAVLPDRFWTWVQLAALLHDAGKIPDGFQRMLQDGTTWGHRHEVYSLGFVARLLATLPPEEREWVALGVVTHHRPLTNAGPRGIFAFYDEDDPEEFVARFGPVDAGAAEELLRWLGTTARAHGLLPEPPGAAPAPFGAEAFRLLGELRDRWEYDCVDPGAGRAAALLQGAVTLADHLSSAHGDLLARQPVDAAYAQRLTRDFEVFPHQAEAGATDGHVLVRAPTGKGKTEAVLLWAANQVAAIQAATGGRPRVFYTLPYLASINAMTDRLGANLDADDIGVAHSRAASYHLARSVCPGDETTVREARKAVSRAAATRLFREPVRVGTPYQLLRGALAGPAHSGILIDAANSVFILDELHAYDARRLGMLLAMLGFWERIGGRIGVISATLPRRLEVLLRDTLSEQLQTVEALGQSWPVRHRLSVREGFLTGPESIAEISGRLRSGQSVLVVANNVADARTLFDALAPTAVELYGSPAATLLHSRFRTMDRTAIEQQIRDRYGVGGQRAPGLLVATQVVEVSLNVDFDVIHTSGAPLEAMIQRFGRVNRLGVRPPADVVVHGPDYRTRRGGGQERADGVYEEAPTRLTMDLLHRNDGAELNERDTGDWLDEIYDSGWGDGWHEQVIRARNEFDRSFLTFTMPFDDRSELADRFDEMFDGVEAVLEQDRADYAEALNTVSGAAGRLLGAQYLLPLPSYGKYLGHYDDRLKTLVIDAEYDPKYGLGEIHGRRGPAYQPGEVM